jgi:hypothetical protein
LSLGEGARRAADADAVNAGDLGVVHSDVGGHEDVLVGGRVGVEVDYTVVARSAYLAPGGGDRTRPASTSPWQLAHKRTHFLASSRRASRPLPRIALTGKDFVAGSTWWKWRFSVHRPYPQRAQRPPASPSRIARTLRWRRVTASPTQRLHRQRPLPL